VAKWFERKRGRALGIAAIGPMAGGLTLAPLIGVLVESFGWRTSLRCFSVGVMVVIPFVWTVIRNRPEDLGQLPDGESGHGAEAAAAQGGVVWTTGQILSARNFWALALGVGIVFGLGGGWNANAPKYAGDLGYSISQAGYLLAVGAGMGIPGTVLFGVLADRLNNRSLLWTAIALQIAAFAALWSGPGLAGLFGAFALFGFSAGALLPLYASLIGRLFGPLSFGHVMGLAGLVMLPFGATGPPLAGLLRQVSGSYASTLLLFMASFVVAAACLGLMRLRVPRIEVQA
jgi:cyanate permease